MSSSSAARPKPDTRLRIERRPLTALGPLADAWRDLAARAAEPNVFYEPDFALAAAPVFGRDAGAVLIWSDEPAPRLLGLFPLRRARGMHVGWTHPFAPLGTPLVDADHVTPVVDAWLHELGRGVALLPFLTADGPIAAAIAQRATRSRDFGTHARALLDPGAMRNGYLRQALSKKAHHELSRQRRRLAECGTLEHRRGTLDDFLVLEASGWKGRAGTAAANDPQVHTFMNDAVAALARRGQAQVDLLTLDGRAIAALVSLRSRSTVFAWKIAYDESFARYSPGLQMLCDRTEAMLADPYLARVDSCAAPGHPMVDRIWRERLTLTDRMVSLNADAAHFAALGAMEALRRAAIANAKALRDRLRS